VNLEILQRRMLLYIKGWGQKVAFFWQADWGRGNCPYLFRAITLLDWLIDRSQNTEYPWLWYFGRIIEYTLSEWC